jgi:hypothetical protein
MDPIIRRRFDSIVASRLILQNFRGLNWLTNES